MAYRDLTKDFAETRLRYIKPAFGGYSSDDEDLHYADTKGSSDTKRLTEDIELGDREQFERQPQWCTILKGVQDNMSNIRNGRMYINIGNGT
jgi:hypothetical protein